MKAESARKTVGYAFVVGDLLHYGHLHFLKECKKHCDFLIVGVYTDELTETYKRRPIIPLEERIELIRELRVVDKVVVVHHRSCVPMLKELADKGWKISFLFHGTDWSAKTDKDLHVSKKFIEKLGGRLVQPEYYSKQTTSMIINEIIKRYNNGELDTE
jgi:glycerol-3-phosphate cytidylyltransferase